jgi:glycine/D-amino acid oxidase-like deaminating enzyme
VVEDEAGSLQPAKLVGGLRRVAMASGARIHEGTAVRRLRTGRRIGVVTSGGTVQADKVVFATNAWGAALGPVKPHVFVTSSDVIATAPAVAASGGGQLASGMALSDSRRMINYWRSTPDGRVVFGKGGGAMSVANRVDRRFTGPSGRAPSVYGAYRRLYPQLAPVPVRHSWCGPIDYSSTGLPYFGPLRPERPAVLIGVGYSGMGVVQSVLGGRILASLVLESDDELATLPLTRRWPVRLPPDPLRSLGAPMVRAAVAHRELVEDAERRPGGLVRLVAAMDPTASPTAS